MQANAPVVHAQKRDRQHQWNGDTHHQARAHINVIALEPALLTRALVKAQGHKTHRQHDHDGFDERAHKFVDRARHGGGLVLHFDQAQACRQRGVDGCGRRLKRFAHGNDVAALAHGNAQAQHLLALEMHLHAGRVNRPALDLGNVAQMQLVARSAANRHGAQLLHRLKLPSHAHLHHVQRGLHRACALNGVLLAQLRQHLVHVQAELRQALLRDFDVNFFVLHAKQFDLVDVGHAQQFLADIVGGVLGLHVREAVGFQRVNHAIDVAKLVIEKRPLHACGQGVTHVAELFAHHVPKIGHLGGLGRILDFKEDGGLAGLGKAADLVGKRHFLQRPLHLVGDLFGHLLRRGARPVRTHHHGPKGEGRVFVLPELEVRGHAQHQQHQHQITGQRAVFQRPARQVETWFWIVLFHAGLTLLPRLQPALAGRLAALFPGKSSLFGRVKAHARRPPPLPCLAAGRWPPPHRCRRQCQW